SRALTVDEIGLLKAYTIPGLARNIAPENGAVSVQVETNLVWDEPLAFTPSKYDLYYKAGDPNLGTGATIVTDIAHTDPCNVYDPPDFDYETTIYWRVDSYAPSHPSDPCIGSVWNFTTAPAGPVITEDPCSLTVAAGDTAVFRVKDINGVTYVWNRQSDGVTVGGNSPVLTLTNVQKDPCEDFYCCIVQNDYDEDISAWAGLWTKRLVARWEFEDDLADSEVDGWDGVYTDPNSANEPPVPVFVLDPCSIDGGKALQLTVDELHVRITDSEDDFNFYPQGYTVNAWVKTVQADAYGAMASKQDRTGESFDWKGWILNCTDDNGKAINSLRQVAGAKGTTNVADDQWRMVTGTYDAETGVVAVYVDGKLETESAPISNVASTNAYPVVFGAGTVLAETSTYEGLLDKMSIYSYALSPIDVAVLYTDVMTGESICLEQPEHDYNDDCRVDLLDFAMLSTGWLECNLVPDCI
ncbi:MAG: LamG domain-containing protein, partial [Sedimentisphaerales bacterium]|nr:LamG domain-containing protein [Sedimentisphaerales bacterium]